MINTEKIKNQFNSDTHACDSKRRVINKECSVNEEVFMLKNAGFKNVQCIFSNLKFAVILAKSDVI